MSMIRTQEYFAPLGTCRISLQQWERGLLFESSGHRGGRRANRRDSVDLDRTMAEDHQQEFQSKKQVSRGLSFPSSLVGEIGSQVTEAETEDRSNGTGLANGDSFLSSVNSIGEITELPQILESDCNTTKSYSGKVGFFKNALDKAQISDNVRSECSSNSDHPAVSRSKRSFPWSRLFISKSFGIRDDTQSWLTRTSTPSFPCPIFRWGHKNVESLGTNLEPGFSKGFLLKILTFSKSFDLRMDTTSRFRSFNIPDERRLNRKKTSLTRELSFSGSLEAEGDLSFEDCSCNGSLSKRSESWSKKFFSRGLSFSRSLDPRGEMRSEICSGSGKSPVKDIVSRFKTVTRGLSFSWSSDARGLVRSHVNSGGGRLSIEEKESRFRTFSSCLSFSRFSNPAEEIQSESNCGSERSSDRDTELRSKTFSKGLSFSRSLDPLGEVQSDFHPGSEGSSGKETPSRSKSFFGRRSCGKSFPEPMHEIRPSSDGTNSSEKDKESHSKSFLSRGLSSLKFLYPNAGNLSGKFFSRDCSVSTSWSRTPSSISSPHQGVVNSPPPLSPASTVYFGSSKLDSNFAISPKVSQALKSWWSKRSDQSCLSTSKSGNVQNSKLVLLEKVPADNQDSDDLTVYVGERGSNLSKYVLSQQIVRHHLFQVLLKCSQDELGSDHDYDSGVPIICDPALFLQVARVVGGNCSAVGETER